MSIAIDITDLLLLKNHQPIINISRLQVSAGEILGIMGPTGSGKTTLLRIIGLLEPPTQGTLSLLGEEVVGPYSDLFTLRRRLGLVFQKPLLRDSSVWNNVALGLKLRKIPKNIIEQRVSIWLDRLQISHLARRHVSSLSLGEAYRVSLAQSLALEGELLLLDEPLACLDAPSRANILQELMTILQETETTTVYVTSNYTDLYLAQRAMLLYQGSIIQEGKPQDIIQHPGSATAASLVGIDNIIPGWIGNTAEDEVEFNPADTNIRLYGTPKDPGLQAAYALIRSDEVELDRFPGPQWNAVVGNIRHIHPQGPLVKIHLDCGFPLVASLSHKKFYQKNYQLGQEVTAVFDPAQTMIVRKSPK